MLLPRQCAPTCGGAWLLASSRTPQARLRCCASMGFDEGLRINEVEHVEQLRSSFYPVAGNAEAAAPGRKRGSVIENIGDLFQAHHVSPDLVSPGNQPFNSTALVYSSAVPLFTEEECRQVMNEVEEAWEKKNLSSSFTFQTNKEAHVKDLPGARAWFDKALESKIFPWLAHLFPAAVHSEEQLRVYDALVIKYNATDSPGAHQPIHRDASLVSFNIALNPEDAYEGGGTYIEPLQRPLRVGQGGLVAHASAVRHGGHAIKSGVRYILVGFVTHAHLHRMEHTRFFKERGMRARREGDVEGALGLYCQAAEVNPVDHELWNYRGICLATLGRETEAEACYHRSVRLNPLDPKPLNNLGVLLYERGSAPGQNGPENGKQEGGGGAGPGKAGVVGAATQVLMTPWEQSDAEHEEGLGLSSPHEVFDAAAAGASGTPLDEALRCFQRAVELAEASGNQEDDPQPVINAGLVLTKQSKWVEAAEHLKRGARKSSVAAGHPHLQRLLKFAEERAARGGVFRAGGGPGG